MRRLRCLYFLSSYPLKRAGNVNCICGRQNNVDFTILRAISSHINVLMKGNVQLGMERNSGRVTGQVPLTTYIVMLAKKRALPVTNAN